MNVNYNNNGMTWSDMIDFMNKAKAFPYYLSSVPTNIPSTEVTNANLKIKRISSNMSFGEGMNIYDFASYGTRMTANAGSRACFVRFPAYVGNDTGYTTSSYYVYCLLTTNTDTPITYVVPETIPAIERYQYAGGEYQDMETETYFESYGLEVYGDSWGYFNYTSRPINDLKTKLDALKTSYGNFKIQSGYNGMGINAYGVPFSTGTGNTQAFSFDEFPFPVFDYDNTDGIKKYLTNGDDSGSVDPFDPNNPKIVKVTDFKTNFKISLTPASNKNGVKVSIIAYNQQYINGADVVAGSCVLHGESKLGSDTSYKGIGDNSLPKYPQITKSFDLVTDVTSNRWVYFVFRDIENVDNHSTWFGVDLIYSDKSASHCKIALVTGGDAINSGSACVRENITDGYRYTRTSTGEYVEIVFRSFDMDDLNDPYDDDDDTEDTSHGEDVDSGVGGKGLRTYAISSAQFEEINNALWSTDWTTVFKSNTINPVNCIMACKSIPFTASAISSGSVTIANLDTEVSANYVTPIKTISCGTITLDKYHKDFTDLTLTKVRVYMPYIGWRELPASEVIGRSAVPECGLLAHNKILSFKYLIDFVDGNCRCVISVNGTERFYFDGNCAIDVPVTSDNHTTAVGNAIKAGVQTVMSVGAGVASGVAGNAVGAVGGAISALQSLPNVVPSYQFTATTSPSGYIDASMPQKIIILIERPVYTVPDNYAHTTGRPCALTLPLGSLSGYTKCSNVDISGVSGTDRQRSEVKQLLESGVYL